MRLDCFAEEEKEKEEEEELIESRYYMMSVIGMADESWNGVRWPQRWLEDEEDNVIGISKNKKETDDENRKLKLFQTTNSLTR